MTVRETVILETPARNAAAPTMAKIPGEIVGINCTMRRPKGAPASRAGIIMPEWALHPNVIIVRINLDAVL